MYPNQTPTPPVPPPDYLNQIAPQAPKVLPFKAGPRLFLIIGAVLVVLVSGIAITLNIIRSAQQAPLETLSARLTTTQTIVNDAQANLKSSQLRSLNSNLAIYLTNTTRDIGEPLLANGINTAKLPDSVTKAESGDAIAARLEDARLNAVFDRTYAREMTYQLSTTLTLMKQIRDSTGSASLKTFLDTAITNLEPTQASFASFDAASS
ncbi:MAG: hypothetical protein WAV04_00420 [Candidatus Microsaccharimonas sp.]